MNDYVLNIKNYDAYGVFIHAFSYTDSGRMVGADHHICNEALNYIKENESFRKAYMFCDNPYWLCYLINILDIKYPLFIKYVYKMMENTKFTFISDIPTHIFKKWGNDYCTMLHYYYPWELIEEKLIKNRIIIKK